jgi:hypothetical protein
MHAFTSIFCSLQINNYLLYVAKSGSPNEKQKSYGYEMSHFIQLYAIFVCYNFEVNIESKFPVPVGWYSLNLGLRSITRVSSTIKSGNGGRHRKFWSCNRHWILIRGFSLFTCRKESLKVLLHLSHYIWMITLLLINLNYFIDVAKESLKVISTWTIFGSVLLYHICYEIIR